MRRILVLVSLSGMAAGVSAGRPADLSPHQMDDPASPPALTAAATRLMDPQRPADAALAAAAPICGVNKALATTTRFCNTAALQFPGAGAASQYPSDIVVSNLAGVVTDVDLVLADVTHTDTSRLAAYLQHPGGQLVGITGSGFDVNAAPFPLVINAQWTFSDSAQIYALLTGSNGSPSYTVPTTNNRYLPRVFAPPALPAPAPAAVARQMLSSLEGLNPNGTWRLWAAQNSGTDPQPFGTIADGWCLDITTAPAAGSCYFTTTRTGSLNAGDVQQTGRITRDGRPSLCGGPTKTPTLENTTAVRRDRYDFPAISAQPVCLTVTADFSQCGGNQTQIVAYRNYNPATPNTGHLADSGYSTSANIAFSTRLAGSQAFSIVVNEVDAGQGCGSYAFRLEADTCQPPPAGDQIFYSGFQLVIPVG
ncbi:MAG: hypothetical protein J0H86_07375 [Xanthomonadaceae bacterium]|nr:hypothetical protein [Xanthomonadaceae bacterium]